MRAWWTVPMLVVAGSLMVSLSLPLAGCGHGGGAGPDVEGAVLGQIAVAAKAVERGDVNGVCCLISPSFLHDGASHRDMENWLTAMGSRYKDVKVSYRVEELTCDGDRAHAVVYSSFEANDQEQGGIRVRVPETGEVRTNAYLCCENDCWMLHGNQQNAIPGLAAKLWKFAGR